MKNSKVFKITVLSDTTIDYYSDQILSEIEMIAGMDFDESMGREIFGKEELFKLKVEKTNPSVYDLILNPQDFEEVKMFEELEGSFGVIKETLVSFTSEATIQLMVKILRKNSCDVKLEDITQDILDEKPYLEEEFGIAQEYIEEFKTYTLSPDDILDKIITSGIESLTEIDKSILQFGQ